MLNISNQEASVEAIIGKSRLFILIFAIWQALMKFLKFLGKVIWGNNPDEAKNVVRFLIVLFFYTTLLLWSISMIRVHFDLLELKQSAIILKS